MRKCFIWGNWKTFTEIILLNYATLGDQERLLSRIMSSTLRLVVSSTIWLYLHSDGWQRNRQVLFRTNKRPFSFTARERHVILFSTFDQIILLFCNVPWTTLRSVLLVWIVVSSASSSHSARRNSGRSFRYIYRKVKSLTLILVAHRILLSLRRVDLLLWA